MGVREGNIQNMQCCGRRGPGLRNTGLNHIHIQPVFTLYLKTVWFQICPMYDYSIWTRYEYFVILTVWVLRWVWALWLSQGSEAGPDNRETESWVSTRLVFCTGRARHTSASLSINKTDARQTLTDSQCPLTQTCENCIWQYILNTNTLQKTAANQH